MNKIMYIITHNYDDRLILYEKEDESDEFKKMFQTNPCFQSILYFKYLDNLKDEIKYIDDKFKPLFDYFIETIKDTCFKYWIYNDYENEEYIGNFISDGYSHEEIEESIMNRKLALKFISKIYDQPMGGWYG